MNFGSLFYQVGARTFYQHGAGNMSIWEVRRSGWVQHEEDARSPFDVDYGRIAHSGSFRRLQGKTQTLNLGDSDFYRTRLTHSLEVAQIASSLVRQFEENKNHEAYPYLPSTSLIQAVGLAHDLGHPPFGHGGEVALNYCMREQGGFEGNGHTLRILSRLENFSDSNGADLTRRAMLGVLKYPVKYSSAQNGMIKPGLIVSPQTLKLIDRNASKPPKSYMDTEADVVDWILEELCLNDRTEFVKMKTNDEEGTQKHRSSLYKSFDCSIMDLADDIAYGVHDLEDAIALKLVTERDFREIVTREAAVPFLNVLTDRYKAEGHNDPYRSLVDNLFGSDGHARKRFIGRLVHHFVTGAEIETLTQFEEPLIKFKAVLPKERRSFLDVLQKLIRLKVIRSPEVQHLEFKGQTMVVSVFEALASDPKSFLPADAYVAYQKSNGDFRVICDHVAGMTDSFLLKTYDRLFSPRMGSVFDRL